MKLIESIKLKHRAFVVNYAEFIVPAKVGAFTIRPFGESEGKKCGTLKAWVRV